MGEKTGISWCDHTFNPWIGCTKVSPGCDHCYAARENERYHWVPEWGHGKPRRVTSEANWMKPAQWASKARSDGVTRRVFCASLADVFDREVDNKWRFALWTTIDSINKTGGGLEWLILTKRPTHIAQMLPKIWAKNPPDCLRIGVSVETNLFDWRTEKLLKVWPGKNFISVEPMLEPVDIALIGEIDWIICGCESGTEARPMDLDWARSLRDDCQKSGTPFFLKQAVIDGRLTKEPYLDGRQWLEFPEVRP